MKRRKANGGYSWTCLECGRLFKSAASAERAMYGDGCPGCGGSDFDQVPVGSVKKVTESDSRPYRPSASAVSSWAPEGLGCENDH